MSSNHPCFSAEAHHQFARVHLPVAPRCNVQCNYCNRKFDCVNESRPGVTSAVLTPFQARDYFLRIKEMIPELTVVGIAGPGDPLANINETVETLRLIRQVDKDISFCVSTNGMVLEDVVPTLVELNVSHITVTVNSRKAETLNKIYAWIRPEKRAIRGEQIGPELIQRQMAGVRAAIAAGLEVKINSILLPGINDDEIESMAQEFSAEGATVQNIIPIKPVGGTPFMHMKEPGARDVLKVRGAAARHLNQMSHCMRCRADAAGKIGAENTVEVQSLLQNISTGMPTPKRPYVAVCTREGFLINQHLGESQSIDVYNFVDGEPVLVERRMSPESGGGEQRWVQLAELLNDCASLLTSGIGPRPANILGSNGLKVHTVEGLVQEGVRRIFEGDNISAMRPKAEFACGSSCQGTATGCG